MIRGALVLGIGLVLAACLALPPPPPTPLGGGGWAKTCSNAEDFLTHVRYLPASFTPRPGDAAPKGEELPSEYVAGLTAAYKLASGAFQQQLCSLDAVYINNLACQTPADCFAGSWGWRQRQAPHGRYVALSTGLWNGPHPQANYAQYETDLFQSVLPLIGAYYYGPISCTEPTCPSGATQTNVDNFGMTILAALAHEVGHVRWYDFNASNPGQAYDASQLCGGKFFANSWDAPQMPPRWRELLTPAARVHTPQAESHQKPPHIKEIDRHTGTPSAALWIYQLFSASQPWASALGAMAPDEDFVETYKFKVLTTASPPLNSVRILFPYLGGYQRQNIANDYFNNRKPDLADKVGCIPASL